MVYDMKGIEKVQGKILKEFSSVNGLEGIVEKVIGLLGSERYGLVYGASVRGCEVGLSVDFGGEELLEMPQVKIAAGILKNPPLYVESLTGVIVAIHFISTMHIIIWIYYTYLQRNLKYEEVLKAHTTIIERLMCCLDGFDVVDSYDVPDESFYYKLRSVKWDKRAKKLFKRLSTLKAEVSFEKFGSGASSFRTGEDFALTFLAACNCVNHERDKINLDDVIMAYKTYLKLIDTDISSL
jgi:hypothetical protein